jgi:hypothetical protein
MLYPGYNGNKNISVWNNTNRDVVDPPRYMEFVAAARLVPFTADVDCFLSCAGLSAPVT